MMVPRNTCARNQFWMKPCILVNEESNVTISSTQLVVASQTQTLHYSTHHVSLSCYTRVY